MALQIDLKSRLQFFVFLLFGFFLEHNHHVLNLLSQFCCFVVVSGPLARSAPPTAPRELYFLGL